MNFVDLSILIPTYNEEKNLRYALDSVKWAGEVFVIDSFSMDRTQEICGGYSNVKFFQHKFENYSAQKNWALTNLPFSSKWIFILDADEQFTPELKEEIKKIVDNPEIKENGFYVNRRFIFLGKWIKHCGWYPSWNLRLFRRGRARYEDREVNEHMILDGQAGYLKNDMIHENHKGIEDWIAKHNKYSTLEARELYNIFLGGRETGIRPSFFGNSVERKRMLREKIWPKIPLAFVFPLRFYHMYFWKLGCFDGAQGFIFSIFQAIQEFNIAVKLRELKMKKDHFSKEEVRIFWDLEPCGVRYCHNQPGSGEFFDFTEKRRKALEPFIKDFVKFDDLQGKKVLEIGCGIGVDTAEFAKAGARIFAIDISQRSVDLTKKRLAYYNLSGEVAIGDAENLDFPENYFDFIYSWGVLHHTPNTQKAIAEIFRVLRPGGKLCVMLYNKRSIVGLQLYILHGLLKLKPFRKLDEIFARYHESPGTRAYTGREVKELFLAFGNVKIATQVTSYDLRIGRSLFLPKIFQRFIPKALGFFLVIKGEKPA